MTDKNLDRLRASRRKTVRLSTESLVETSWVDAERRFPLMIRPAAEGLDLTEWMRGHLGDVGKHLRETGAILFRGFRLESLDSFETIASVVCPELADYVEGSTPREKMSSKVYTSSEYPAEQTISMHNELSYAKAWPAKLFFYCDVAPAAGGQTPVADCRRVLSGLPVEIRDEFREKGVRYKRNLRGDKGLGLSWQAVFETSDRGKVEEYCRRDEIRFEWRDDGSLTTSQERPAIVCHPETGEEVWFNQADQFHPSNLSAADREALLQVVDRERLPIDAEFGDGSPLDPAVLDTVRDVFDRESVVFDWERGDLLIVDNLLVAHGRRPFEGPRRILVAMG